MQSKIIPSLVKMLDSINVLRSDQDIINMQESPTQINFIFPPSVQTEAGCALHQVLNLGLILTAELNASTQLVIQIQSVQWVDQQREKDWSKG